MKWFAFFIVIFLDGVNFFWETTLSHANGYLGLMVALISFNKKFSMSLMQIFNDPKDVLLLETS
jgi:hypothetical protein